MAKPSEIFQGPPIDCGANRDYFTLLANEFDTALLRFAVSPGSFCCCRTDGRGTLIKEVELVSPEDPPELQALLQGKSMRLRYERERFRRAWVEGLDSGLCEFRGGLRQAILDLRAAAAIAAGVNVDAAVRAAAISHQERQNLQSGCVVKEDLAALYCDFLRQKGYTPEIDEDGDVVFRDGKNVFVIIIEENDTQFFRLIFPNFWPIESEEERQKARVAAEHVNHKIKVVKCYIQRDNVCAAIEAFFPLPHDFRGVFQRMLSTLRAGIQEFVSNMRQ